jgi:hypothetical protein
MRDSISISSAEGEVVTMGASAGYADARQRGSVSVKLASLGHEYPFLYIGKINAAPVVHRWKNFQALAED